MSYGLIGADDLVSEIVSGLGNSEIVGYDDDDVGEIGATRKARGGKSRLAVNNRALTRARRMAIGFGPTALAALSPATDIATLPQVVFRPERLFIPSDIAFDIVVVDVKIGNRSQLVAAGALPGAIFSEVSVDVFTHWDTAEVGNQIVLTVQNINTGLARTFRGAMIGAAAIA